MKKILIVEDQQVDRNILTKIFKEHYFITCVSSGEECLEILKSSQFDLVMLDITMPGMSGYEVCSQIRSNELEIPVVFCSASTDDINFRLKCYEVGGDDYITKPFQAELALQKVNTLFSCYDKACVLKQEHDDSSSTLMQTMTTAGELAVVVLFLRESYLYKTNETLVKSSFKVLKNFRLSGAILVKPDEEIFFSDDVPRPLEQDLLLSIKNKKTDKLITLGNRFIINSPSVSLLVRNMPDDEEVKGRLRDHLAIMMDSLNIRIDDIKSEQLIEQRKQRIIDTIKETKHSLLKIEDKNEELRIRHLNILSQLGANLEKTFMRLALTGNEESMLQSQILSIERFTEKLYKKNMQLEKKYDSVLQDLNDSISVK